MSVSNVDRSRAQSEELARTRQEYQERETEQAKRNDKQLSNVQKKHAEEVRKIGENFSKARTEQTDAGHRALTDRDRKYQSEMDDLKKMHVQRMKDQMEKYDADTHMIREVKDNEIKGTEDRSKRQVDNVLRNHENGLREKDEVMSHALEDVHEAQAKGLNDQHKDLVKHYDKEIKTVEKERKDTAETLGDALTNERERHRADAKTAASDKNRALGKKDDAFMRAYQDMSEGTNDLLTAQRQGNQDSVHEMDRRYSRELNKISKGQKESRDAWADQVMNRQDTEVANLKQKLHSDKTASQSRENNVRRLTSLEKKHVMEDADDRINELDRRRIEDHEQMKDNNVDDINKVTKKYDGVLQRQSKSEKNKIDEIRGHEVGAYKTIAEEAESREKDMQVQTESRERKHDQAHLKEIVRSQDFYTAQHQDSQRVHEDTLNEQRLHLEGERDEAVSRLRQKLRDEGNLHNAKLDSVTTKYEGQLTEVKDENTKELARRDVVFQQRFKEQDRRFAADFNRERARNNLQTEQLRDKYEKEIDFLKKRHEQEKIELAKKKV